MLSKCTAENHSIDEINKSIWILQFICVWITLFYLTDLIRSLNLFFFLWSLLFFRLWRCMNFSFGTAQYKWWFILCVYRSVGRLYVSGCLCAACRVFCCCRCRRRCCYFYCFVHFACVCICVCERIHPQMVRLTCMNSASLLHVNVWMCKIRSDKIHCWRF